MAERIIRTGFLDGCGSEAPPVRPSEYLVVDFESTGLSPDALIVEAACVRVRGREDVHQGEALPLRALQAREMRQVIELQGLGYIWGVIDTYGAFRLGRAQQLRAFSFRACCCNLSR